MASTADLSLHQLYGKMASAYLAQIRAATPENTEAKALAAAEANDFAAAILERDYSATGAILYRVLAFLVLAQFLPGEGGVIHAQEAVRLVDVDMRAQGLPQYVFDRTLTLSRLTLTVVKRKLELEERARVLQAEAAADMKRLKELEAKQPQEAEATQEAGGEKTV